jgi:predicted amidohydrolase
VTDDDVLGPRPRENRAPLRIAAAQAGPVPGDVTANAATAAQLVRLAATVGADVVVLPELFLTGCDLDLLRTGPPDTAVIPGDHRLDELAAACYTTRTVAIAGACVRRGGNHTNSAVVVGRDGESHIAYDKQHPHGEERSLFRPGTQGCTVEIAGWRLGLAIGYDISFPEHARAAVLDGCDAYVCCTLTTRGDNRHRGGLYLATRALENTCYTVAANHVGRTARGHADGTSAVYGPDGRTVVEAATDRTDVVTATLQDIELDAARECLTMLDDLRTVTTLRRESVKLD